MNTAWTGKGHGMVGKGCSFKMLNLANEEDIWQLCASHTFSAVVKHQRIPGRQAHSRRRAESRHSCSPSPEQG